MGWVMSWISALLSSVSVGVAINRVHTAVFVKHFPEQDQKSKWRQGEYCKEEVNYKHLMSLYDQTVTTTDRFATVESLESPGMSCGLSPQSTVRSHVESGSYSGIAEAILLVSGPRSFW
jgi:hypothetical protein